MIKSLYTDYFQKSKIFLYPALGIARGTSVTPIETYTSWTGHYDHKDHKLIVTYHLRSDKDFMMFEKAKLLGNPYFMDFYESTDDKGIYVFDYNEFESDWEYYLEGRYSKFSTKLKSLVKVHYSKSKTNYVYVDSYLNPEMYYGIYSKLLDCDKKMLEDVGELCSKPDFEKETLVSELKPLELSGFDITSP